MGNQNSRNDVANIAARLASVSIEPSATVTYSTAFYMETVPIELWEVIFGFTDDEALAIAVPRINKYTRNLAHPNSSIWRSKCKSKGIAGPTSDASSWKRQYFAMHLNMFPLLGHKLGVAKYEDLKNHPGATCGSSGSSRYVTIEKHNFWVDDKGIFTHMYIARGIYPVPKEWEDFGITWARSYNEYKDLFKRWNGNFKVDTAPHLRLFQEKPCFSARLTTVARGVNNLCHLVDLNFNYSAGKEDSSGTLYSISISAHNYVGANNYEQRYAEQKLEDLPSQMDQPPKA